MGEINWIKKLWKKILLKPEPKQKTRFGKTLIIWKGEASADDEDGDSWATYKVVDGKVKAKVLEKRNWQSKDKQYYDRYEKLSITPTTRTALILYETHKGPAFFPTKKHRVRLFKDFKHKNKKIVLGVF